MTPTTSNRCIQFGIPTLDELIGSVIVDDVETFGIQPPAPHLGDVGKTSVCIIGPDGTGKSVLALHLASRYCADADPHCKVLYASTDLSRVKARSTWKKFSLDKPNSRIIPFLNAKRPDHWEIDDEKALHIEMQPCTPADEPHSEDSENSAMPAEDGEAGSQPIWDYLLQENIAAQQRSIAFIDLEAATAGDDWGFLNRILATLKEPEKDKSPHLLIIDAVEGLETLVGDLDAYGQPRTRRSRVAQIMRAASRKCHIVFVVEEPAENTRLPEEFVSDVVIRLRCMPQQHSVRRMVEVVKARGQAHEHGTHDFVIREGSGTTTGSQPNPDDPEIPLYASKTSIASHTLGTKRPRTQAYFHVFHSVDHLTRKRMRREKSEEQLPLMVSDVAQPRTRMYADFGITHLDDMLAADSSQQSGQFNSCSLGLPGGSVTALIGDDGTHKNRLGRAYLSRCFADLLEPDGRKEADKGVAVLLTTQDLFSEALAHLFWKHLPCEERLQRRAGRDNDFTFQTSDFTDLYSFIKELRHASYPNLYLKPCLLTYKSILEALCAYLQTEDAKSSGYLSAQAANIFDAAKQEDECRRLLFGPTPNSQTQEAEKEHLKKIKEEIQKSDVYAHSIANKLNYLFKMSLAKEDTDQKENALPNALNAFESIAAKLFDENVKPLDNASLHDETRHIYSQMEKVVQIEKARKKESTSGTAEQAATQNTDAPSKSPQLIQEEKQRARDAYATRYAPLFRLLLEDIFPDYIRNGVLHEVAQRTICRRLDFHQAFSSSLLHVVQCAVQEAKKFLCGDSRNSQIEFKDYRRLEGAERIRVVIYDWSTIKDAYPGVANDPLFLPYLLRYLKSEGVTTLFIDTQAGNPQGIMKEEADRELRSLVDYHLYTWHLPFFGESRIAIAAIPPIKDRTPVAIRELLPAKGAGNECLHVDRHFEMYAGLEEGKPERVPLRVRLFAPFPSFTTYVERTNHLFNSLYRPAPAEDVWLKPAEPQVRSQAKPLSTRLEGVNGHGSSVEHRLNVLLPVGPEDYEMLQEFYRRHVDVRRNHTELFTVDEFWKSNQNAPTHEQAYLAAPRRALNAEEADASNPDAPSEEETLPCSQDAEKTTQNAHPALPTTNKQPTKHGGNLSAPDDSRHIIYETHSYSCKLNVASASDASNPTAIIDRIPYMWDFGVLLCMPEAWQIVAKDKNADEIVRRVWDRLTRIDKVVSDQPRQAKSEYVSWKDFLLACQAAAKYLNANKKLTTPSGIAECIPFDFDPLDETLSCLVLEVWFSQIKASLLKKKEEAEKTIKDKNDSLDRVNELKGSEQLKKQNKESADKAIAKSKQEINSISDNQGALLNIAKRQEGRSLVAWLKDYKQEFSEAINMLRPAIQPTLERSKGDNKPVHAVASRHWYSTASSLNNAEALRDIPNQMRTVAVGLPGSFAVRGDWFLAITQGSRSLELAWDALDNLSTTRANWQRLRQGLGLPTVKIAGAADLFTALAWKDQNAPSRGIKYKHLLDLGAKNTSGLNSSLDQYGRDDFYWLWRSSLKGYDRQARIWRDWLEQELRASEDFAAADFERLLSELEQATKEM